MLEFNLKSFTSRVDSHIIDYPINLLFFCFTTFFLIVLVFPTLIINLLFLLTFYYLYKGLHQNIFIIWGFYIFSWYILFTALLFGFEGQILIGSEYTGLLFSYVLSKFSKFILLKSFCMKSIIMLDALSSTCGFNIYIPSIFNGVFL